MKYICLFLLVSSFIAVSTAQEQDTGNIITQLPIAVQDARIIGHNLSTQEQTTNKAGESVIPVIETIGTLTTTVVYTIIDATPCQE